MPKKEETYEDLKNLLGYMGIEILVAINNGAKNYETIKLFSGLPISCINGRIPVLRDLGLIQQNNDEYFLTEKGIRFRNKLEGV
ncbi:MAG: winged helix-turn-helix domain-containing protein [Candidatus Hermodarchaeota archaeon]